MDVLILGILVLVALAGGQQQSQPSPQPTPEPEPEPEPPALPPPEPDDEWPESEVLDRQQIEEIASELGLPADWGRFLAAVAWGESRFHTAALNEADASAAQAAYNRNRDRYDECPWPEERYTRGSYGLYQMLPANALAAWWGTEFQCIDPIAALTDPYLSTIAAVEYARRVMRWSDWAASDRDWFALRRAWRAPGLADEDRPDVDNRFRQALEAVGLSESWARQKVPALPSWDIEEVTAPYVEEA